MEYYKITTPGDLECEVWKTIEGFEGFYEVSSLGRVRSLPRIVKGCHNSTQFRKGKILKQKIKKNGYLFVCLAKDAINTYPNVHRLVAKAFIPNPNNYEEVNHINEVKTLNAVWNLEWCNHSYNNTFGSKIERGVRTMITNGNACDPSVRKKTLKERRHQWYENVGKFDPNRKERNRLAQQRCRQRKKAKALESTILSDIGNII